MGAFQKFLYGFSFAVLVLALSVSAHTFFTNEQVAEQVGALPQVQRTTDVQGVSEGSGEQPSEEAVEKIDVDGYRVAANMPRVVTIPSLGTEARIKALGDKNGAVDAPWNVHDAGWYDGSVLPGSNTGVSLIVGHVSGYSTPGVFKHIGSLSSGDVVTVEMGDGSMNSYRVTNIKEQLASEVDMNEVLYKVPTGQHSLRLMTCSGGYDPTTEEYDSRIIVYTEPV